MTKLKLSINLLALLFVLFTASACTSDPADSTTKVTDLVKVNAKLTMKSSGKGNVKKVSTEGYECKTAN